MVRPREGQAVTEGKRDTKREREQERGSIAVSDRLLTVVDATFVREEGVGGEGGALPTTLHQTELSLAQFETAEEREGENKKGKGDW